MKNLLLLFLVLILPATRLAAQCNAQFTWEQIPGTLNLHFHSTSTSEHTIVTYQWFFGDGQQGDGSAPYHTYSVPGVYNVCLVITDDAGCVDEVCHEVTVQPASGQCEAAFTWEQIAGTLTIHFNNNSYSEHDIVSNVWTFGDGHSGDGQNPNHTYEEPGTYVVCLTITDNSGCVDDVCHEVVVEAPSGDCTASFTWEQLPGTLTLHFHSTAESSHDIISYQWFFGDGQQGDGQAPYHTYLMPGVYNVCLVITDATGCVDEQCHEVVVEAAAGNCEAAFTWEQVPGTLTIHFNNNSYSEHDIVSNVWNFGDGHTGDGQNPNHTYSAPGVYVVCLTITDNSGCVDDVCREVVVEGVAGTCEAAFTWEQLPGTLTLHFHSTSSSPHDIVSYQWIFGDGHQGDGQAPYHTYPEPGVYNVCLIITDAAGCIDDICHEVVVEAASGQCEAAFTWEQIPGSLTIHFDNNSSSNHDIVSNVWHFGDGHTGDGLNPTHTYLEPGTYEVCLTITDNAGCVDDVCHTVIVVPGEPMGASFGYSMNPRGLSVLFSNQSHGGSEQMLWTWDFGDGTSSQEFSPVHSYTAAGVYKVCLTMFDPMTFFSSRDCHLVFYYSNGTQWAPGDGRVPVENLSGERAVSPDRGIGLQYTSPADETLCVRLQASSADVVVGLYDFSGRQVAQQAVYGTGLREIVFATRDLLPGVYALRVMTGQEEEARLLLIAH